MILDVTLFVWRGCLLLTGFGIGFLRSGYSHLDFFSLFFPGSGPDWTFMLSLDGVYYPRVSLQLYLLEKNSNLIISLLFNWSEFSEKIA